MNLTLIDFRNNPDLRRTFEAAARRERARQLGGLIGKALAHLFTRNDRHAARTHFARQG